MRLCCDCCLLIVCVCLFFVVDVVSFVLSMLLVSLFVVDVVDILYCRVLVMLLVLYSRLLLIDVCLLMYCSLSCWFLLVVPFSLRGQALLDLIPVFFLSMVLSSPFVWCCCCCCC